MSGLSPEERRRNARELEQLMRELDDLDERYGLGALPTGRDAPSPLPVAPRPRRSRGALVWLITSIVVIGAVLLGPGQAFDDVRRLAGLGPGRLEDARSGPGGSHAFLMTQPRSGDPVGYDPCEPIRVEVNPAGAPSNWESLVDTAIAHTSEATGLRFERVGTTDSRDFFVRRTISLVDHAPVLVGWADEDEVAELAGRVAGLGGSSAREYPDGRSYYVTGSVLLDSDSFDALDRSGGGDLQQAIVDHEFGHLVGLDHVSDPGELMAEQNTGLTTYGPGDLTGLAAVGAIPCR